MPASFGNDGDLGARAVEVFQNHPDALFVLTLREDGAFAVEACNAVALRVAGFSLDAIRGRALHEYLPSGVAAAMTAHYRRAIETGAEIDYEEAVDFGSGSRVLRTVIVPLRDGDGRIRWLAGYAHDITAHRRAEEAFSRTIAELTATERALRESEERFSRAFQVSPDSITISDLETGRILEMNEGFERVFGWGRSEALGRTTLDLDLWIRPEERRRLYEAMVRDGGVRDFPALALRQDGERRHVLISMVRSEINGRPCAITVARDVTDRFRAEQALRDSEERFSKAFRASPFAVTISDAESGVYLDINGGFEELSGYSRAEAVGRSAVELGIWPSANDRQTFVARLRATGSVREVELELRTRSGRLVPVRNSSEVIEIGGRPCIVSTSQDLTAQRAAEQVRAKLEAELRQAQKLEALGTLAGGIAHDFNNVLGGLFAYLDLAVLDAEHPNEVRSHLAEARHAAERARDLVSQILAFSRKQKPERKPLDVATVVNDALRLLRSSLPATLAIESTIDPRCPAVLADATQLHQVVMNLCTNAAHALAGHGGELAIRLEPVLVGRDLAEQIAGLRPGLHARLTVADNGVGMSDEMVKRIFEPFFTTKAPGQGTGLGLSVVHGIVQEHEGALTVESALGEGTRFAVYLPQHESVPSTVPAAARVSLGRGERLLLIDDEQAICRTLQMLLQRLGYDVTAFADPLEALRSFEMDPERFDLVLTDLTMPGLTGIDVARAVLARRPELPVLLTSGFSAEWTSENVRAVGIRDLLDKPVSVPALAAALRQALDQPASD